MQAAVLLCMPPALLLAVSLLNPNYTRVLFDNSGVLVGVFISELIGALWIRKIVNFEF
jgi:tight adherence protein B